MQFFVEQIFYYPKIWNRMKEYKNWNDKISVALNGPGWAGPGSPRLGDINDVPEVQNLIYAWLLAIYYKPCTYHLVCLYALSESKLFLTKKNYSGHIEKWFIAQVSLCC